MLKLRYLLLQLVLFLTLACLVVTPEAEAFKASGADDDCMKCHTLTKEEAGKILKVDEMKASIVEIKQSPVKGLWHVGVEMEVEVQGEQKMARFPVYLDFSKTMLLQGKIDFIPVDKLGFAAVEDGAGYADVSKIPLEGAVIYGKKKAKHKIIVFDDPDCPFCKKLQAEIEKVIKKRKDIVFYKLLYPLPIHPKAYDKAKAIVCEKSEKKSRKLLKDAYEGKKLPLPACETDIVDENIALAAKLGINGTPGIIMPDGLIVSGYREADALIAILDRTDERVKARQAAGKDKDFVKPAPASRAKPTPKSKYVDLAEIPLADAVLMGAKGAKNRVIVFDDPDCPYCRKLHVEIKKILEDRKDISFFIKMYPLPMHPQAKGKSEAIVCEKSLKLLDDAFAGKALPKASCETTAVDETIALAARLGIRGTPAIIMPDGFIVSGYLPAPQLLKMIDGSEDRKKARKAAGE